ncbi:hypothetical protein RN001_003415 [Aquatica leii]|uniref:Uncharacterized protein n=1 Tax=Aquatica leii TaxID=1421715 RepID=A0AAN7SMA7_9COLE|nr:hypothetical protein RN001_003415 [Aquatica leii]
MNKEKPVYEIEKDHKEAEDDIGKLEESRLSEEENVQEEIYYKKLLTAHELLEEIKKIDDVSQLPDSVVLYPPINANGENTDEDSGEDDDVTMDNLPGSQLNAPAEAIYGQKEDNLYDSEDELPLSNFLKEKHFKKKPRNFSWEQKDLLCNLPQWQEDYSPKNQQSPVEIFTSFLDDSLIEMLVDQSN